MSICLTNDEIVEFTHMKKYSKQREVLNDWGIDHRVRPDGTIAVMREWLANHQQSRKPKKTEPTWENVR